MVNEYGEDKFAEDSDDEKRIVKVVATVEKRITKAVAIAEKKAAQLGKKSGHGGYTYAELTD